MKTLIGLTIAGLSVISLCGCGKFQKVDKAIIKSYAEYSAALQAGDQEAIKKFLAEDKRKEIDNPMFKQMLPMILAMRPKEYTVSKVQVDKDKAVLFLDASMDGNKVEGMVDFVRTDGSWLLSKESWTVKMDMASSSFSVGTAFLPAGNPMPKQMLSIEAHADAVSGIIYSQLGDHMISYSYGDYTIKSWGTSDGRCISAVTNEARPSCIALIANGTRLLVADVYKNLKTYKYDNGVIGEVLDAKTGVASLFAVSPDEKIIVTGGYHHETTVFSFQEMKELKKLGAKGMRNLMFSPDGSRLVASGDGNTYNVWDTAKWKCDERKVSKVCKTGQFYPAMTRDGKLLLLGNTDSSVVLADLAGGKELLNYAIQTSTPVDLAFSADGKIYATANMKNIIFWDTASGKQLGSVDAHTMDVSCLRFSPDGAVLASGGQDRRIKLWSAMTGTDTAKPAQAAAQPPAPAAPGAGPVIDLQGQRNIVINPSANDGPRKWKADGEATIEAKKGGDNPYFAVRYNASFTQDIFINEEWEGKYALIMARSLAERVEDDGDQTGAPYIYGYWVNRDDSYRFNGYLNDDRLKLKNVKKDEWSVIACALQIPPKTATMRLMLDLADGGKPQNGSAAIFDDVAVYIVKDEKAAGDVERMYKAAAKKLNTPAQPAAVMKKPLTAEKAQAKPAVSKKPQSQTVVVQPVGDKLYVGKRTAEVRRMLGWPPVTFKKDGYEFYVYPGNIELKLSKGVVVDEYPPEE